MRGETIVLTHRESQRLMVLNALDRGGVLMADAAILLGLSIRQVRRLRSAYRARGPTALAHGNRGRPSPRRVPQAVRAQVLAQVDGSHHDWLEGRGPRLVLHAAVDDATGEVLSTVFRDEEDAWGYLFVFREIARTRGLPLAVYSDRHGIFARTPRRALTLEKQPPGGSPPTQVGRALPEAGIRWIPA